MNFGGAEIISDYKSSGIVIVPVPYDETSTWMKGADKGPDAILIGWLSGDTICEMCKTAGLSCPISITAPASRIDRKSVV